MARISKITSKITSKIIFALFILTASQSFAQTIQINPGDQVWVQDAPTLVYCKDNRPPFKMYCKCVLEGFSRQPTLELILDREGNTDNLSTYDTLSLCENAIRTNPACAK